MLLLADPDEVDATDPELVDETDPDVVDVTDPDEMDATDPDGVGASAALGPAVARLYRNMSQNRQLRLGNSTHVFVKKFTLYATSSLDY